jgi:hypothetical protein
VPQIRHNSLRTMLEESVGFKREGVEEYRRLLSMAGDDLALEEFARSPMFGNLASGRSRQDAARHVEVAAKVNAMSHPRSRSSSQRASMSLKRMWWKVMT